MGVQGLGYLLYDSSPTAINKETTLKAYQGKTIAFDASQYLYDSIARKRTKRQMEKGEETRSPLVLTFNSCVRLLENGIKPLFVFDGHAPKLKQPVIKERRERREVARLDFEVAQKKGDKIKMETIRPQTVKVTKTVTKNCKQLLKLMGIPYFNAPSEAEAQCATFVKSGLVYGTATMDLDALTFGTKVVLRNIQLLGQATKRSPVDEIHLEKVLVNLCLSFEEFVELSVIMGCDYCAGIKGLGAHKAIELIHKYKTIENILENIDTSQYKIPDFWLYKEARDAFLNPKVKPCEEIEPFTWSKPDVQGTIDYLSAEKGFEEKNFKKRLRGVEWDWDH